jgi:hypothetical protein
VRSAVTGVGVASMLGLAACSDLFGGHRPRVVVSVDAPAAAAGRLVLQADIGGRRVRVTSVRPGVERASVEVRGPRLGAVPVRVTLETAAGENLGAVTFTHRLERDNAHWVSGLVATRRPVGHCIGEVVATPLRAVATAAGLTASDSLFVMYGRIPEGAVC